MGFVHKTLRTGMAATLLLTGLTVGAQGDIGAGGSPFGPDGTGTVQIRGTVLCAACSLEEVRHAQPSEPALYQLSFQQGQVVMRIDWVSTPTRWQRVVWPPRLWVRGEDGLLQQLSAETNLFKKMEIQGILSNTRTLDLASITLSG
jgi:hypothetical protein